MVYESRSMGFPVAFTGNLPRTVTNGTFYLLRSRARVSFMATTTKTKYHCMQCDMTEDKCDCEKYCCSCQGQIDIRLCSDGLYYCPPCREASGYRVSD